MRAQAIHSKLSNLSTRSSVGSAILLGVLLLTGAREAAAKTTTIANGESLQAAINAATDGDTILVGPGTYRPDTGTSWITVSRAVTIMSTAGTAQTIIQGATADWGLIWIQVSGVTLQGFTIQGGNWGPRTGTFTNGKVSNILLKDLIVDTVPSASAGHGINLCAENSVVQDCTVIKAYATGIIVSCGGGNLIMNNTVQRADTQHAIGLIGSDGNTVVNNTITGAAFDGILIQGGSYNRVEKNRISGHGVDGVTLSSQGSIQSRYNYVAKNVIISDGVGVTGRWGTGVWVDRQSDGAYVFGNRVTGQAEAGLTVFSSNSAWFRGNVATHNGHAGFLIWDHYAPALPKPSNTFIQNNIGVDNPANGHVLLRGADTTEIAYNSFSNSVAGQGVGISLENSPAHTFSFRNTVKGSWSGSYVNAGSVDSQFYQNRYIGQMSMFSLAGSATQWDAGAYLGGNYWSQFQARGNPSQVDRFTGFTGSGSDNFPYQSEDFGKGYAVAVQQPAAGQIVAAGSQKTIAWKSKGCVLVDLAYSSASTGLVLIAQNFQDSGFYNWDLPASLPPASDYSVRIDCKTAAGSTVGVTGQSGSFSVGTAELLLLAPGPDTMASAGSTVRVAWKKAASISSVDILLKYDGVPYSVVRSNLSGSFADVTLPNINSNHVSILVQASAGGNAKDSVDGYVSIRGGAPGFTAPAAPSDLFVGEPLELEWISPAGSYLVDLEIMDTDPVRGGSFRPVARNLPDYGKYTWFVPDLRMVGGWIRATFKSASGTTISSIASPLLNLRYTSNGGPNVPPYAVELAPFEGAAVSQVFTGTYYDDNGWSDIAKASIRFYESYLGQPNACIVEFRPPSSQLFLLDDAGVNWLGPVTLGSSATLQNSACSLNAAASSFSGNGNTLQVNVALSFKPGFGSAGGREPRKAVCLYAKDNAGAGEEQSCLGLWIPEAPTPALIARHRLYNPYNYAHFYTASENERNVLVSRGFIPENPIPGMGYNQPNTVSGIPTQPFYRILYFPANGAASFHYWTRDREEYKAAVRQRTRNLGEGIDSFLLSGQAPGTYPTYRLKFPGASAYPIYHYALQAEHDALVAATWISLGIDGYLQPVPAAAAQAATAMRMSGSSTRPQITAVLGAASHEAGAVAPGQLIRVYGRSLSNLPQVQLDDTTTPVLSRTDQYLEILVPEYFAGKESVAVTVNDQGRSTEPFIVPLTAVSPALFVTDFQGRGWAATLESEPGTSTLQLTGAGELDGGQPRLPVSVRISGHPAEVISIGPIAGQQGRLAVNVRIPAAVLDTSDEVASVTVQIGEAVSQPGVLLKIK